MRRAERCLRPSSPTQSGAMTQPKQARHVPPDMAAQVRGTCAPAWAGSFRATPEGAGAFWRTAASLVGPDESSSLPPRSFPALPNQEDRLQPARRAAFMLTLPQPVTDWFAAKGWTPRRHQLELLAAAHAGRSALLVAPTGAGKTLA